MKKYFIALLLTCCFAAPAFAAGGSLTLSASSLKAQVGKTFTIAVKATSGGVITNTVGADIVYPSDLLDVVSVSGPSIITLPITNGFVSPGLVSFQGGIVPSKTLSSSPIGTILFKTKGTGTATISIASTSGIYADDGKGTDLLANRGAVSVTIVAAAPAIPPPVNKPAIPPPVIVPPTINAPVIPPPVIAPVIPPPVVAPLTNQPLNTPGPTESSTNLETTGKHLITQQTLVNIAIATAVAAIILIIYFSLRYLNDTKRKKRK